MADLTQGTVDAALKGVRDLRATANEAEVDPAVRVREIDPVEQAHEIIREEMEEGQKRAIKRILDINSQDDLRNRIQAILDDKR
jgi:hypothetical protein